MNGIGGQQPISQTQVSDEDKSPASGNGDTSQERCKNSSPSGDQNFFSTLPPSGLKNKSIQSRVVKPAPHIPQHFASNGSNV